MHVTTDGNVRVDKTADPSMGTNSYLVQDLRTDDAAVIDANLDPEATLALVAERAVRVRAILLTHTDFDHVAGLRRLRQAWGEPAVAVAEPELDLLRGGRPLRTEMAHAVAPEADAEPLVAHGSYRAGSLRFDVLPTPGHSPGGVTLVTGRLLFTGDALFQGSIGRFDFANSDGQALLLGIRAELLRRDDEDVVLPGHGPASTIGEERRRNPFLQVGFVP
ncbi:MAG: MBL fold metallo-hydrolase [Candidatus Dormibacteraceae bacterium]